MQMKWNTGAQYTKEGQRIAACTVDGGIVFVDIDRGIDGFVPVANAPRDKYALEKLAMTSYDFGNYNGAWQHPDAVREMKLLAQS